MRIVDAQIHISAPNSREFPWNPAVLAGASGDQKQRFASADCGMDRVISMMNESHVSGAIPASRGAVYRSDPTYALAAAKRYPGRFAVAGAVYADIENPKSHIAEFRKNAEAVAIRIVVPTNSVERLTSPRYRAILEAAEELAFPVFVHVTHTPGMVVDVDTVARDYPRLTLVLDHLGLDAPLTGNSEEVAVVLRLARRENVAIKCAGFPDLSVEDYPYHDLWPALSRIIDAYGAERVMWASDITAHLGRLSYRQAVGLIRDTDRLPDRQKELILGGSLQRLLHWPITAYDTAA